MTGCKGFIPRLKTNLLEPHSTPGKMPRSTCPPPPNSHQDSGEQPGVGAYDRVMEAPPVPKALARLDAFFTGG